MRPRVAMGWIAAPAALALSLAPAGRVGPAAAAEPPQLGGIWLLDRERSEDPWEKLRAAGAPVRDPWGGLRGPRRPDLSRLVIRHQEPEVTIYYPDGGRRRLLTDGSQLEAEMEFGYVQASARWKGEKLVYTAETLNGATVFVRWQLADGGRRLVVTTRLDGGPGGRRVSFRRIYDRQEPVTGEPGRSSDGSEANDTPPQPTEGDQR